MSFHDNLAQKAAKTGKSSSEFTEAAQRHANATWFYMIAAGVVWYFFGWGWASIPVILGIYTVIQSISATMIASRLEKTEQNSETSNPEFVRIVQAYGNTLETSAPVPGTVADARKLPYTKQQIKDAIVAALRITDDPKMKENLKLGYIQLSDWQEGVGENNLGLDLSDLDKSQDAEALAKAVLERSGDSERWSALVRKEQDVLKKELYALNLW